MPKLILVVDDELFAFRRIHVEEVSPNLYDVLADSTDPVFENLYVIAQSIPIVCPHVPDEHAAAEFFATDAAVHSLFLSAELTASGSAQLLALLAPFFGRVQQINLLRKYFLDAFPSPEFEVEFAGAPRPLLGKVVGSSAIFFDLFLQDGAAAPVEQIQLYLKGLSEQAENVVFPPIVIMSLHSELNDHKRNFSERAQISAAGLMVLPKSKISEPQFQSVGLRLSYDQLTRQSAVAHSMRSFVNSWMQALEQANRNTAKTLWNLDASAMQQIHFASNSDDDPYDEHLNELLCRDYLFSVEADGGVGARIQELDKRFQELLSEDGRNIANRLIAPLTDIGTSRSLMSHFTWLGSNPSVPFLAFSESECASRISRSLPFGSVLCGGAISDGSKCLVHITQQCDLNSISRDKSVDSTLKFAIAVARELQITDNPVVGNSEFVAKNLQIFQDGVLREFDLKLQIGEMIALSLHEFISVFRHRRLRQIGRLRSDITNQIVSTTNNHMSRPASQKMVRPALFSAKVFLQSAKLKNGNTALMETEKKAQIYSLTREGELFSFQDVACVEISLWLAKQLSDLKIKVDVDTLCTDLRRGWRTDKQLSSVVMAKVRDCQDLGRAFRALVAGDVDADSVQFTVVFERKS